MILNKFRLDGQRALVLGGGQGFGRLIAVSLAKAGADILLADKNETTGKRVVREVEQRGRTAIFYHVGDDLKTDLADLAVLTEKNKLNIAVNVPYMSWESVRDYCLVEMESMKKQGRGKIINIASMSALIVNTESTYCITKAAVAMEDLGHSEC
jgi:NAD(P)-dependent dehydrogenase (short-subunit alcohol dehydrogenase family)